MPNSSPSIDISRLNNGITVITEYIPWVKSCSIGIFVKVGSIFEAQDEYGFSHFLEHMIFRGTKTKSAKEVYETVERAGGAINAFTSREYTCYYGKIISESYEILLNILEELVFEPALPKADMSKEKQVILQEIDSSKEEPFEYITDEFIKRLWPGQVFGRNILGNKTSIRRLSHEKLVKFYKKHYTPQNIIISCSGNVKHNAFLKSLKYSRAAVASSGPPNSFESIRVDRKRLGRGAYFLRDDTDQYHIFYGVETFGRRDPRRYVLNVLSIILGGPLMTARLYRKMRDIYGIAYDVSTFVSMTYDTGLFGIYAATNRKNVDMALNIINDEINSIRQDSIEHTEFETVLAQVKNSLVFEQESTGKRMLRIGRDYLYKKRVITMDEILERYNRITEADVKALANTIFSQKPLLLVLGQKPIALKKYHT